MTDHSASQARVAARDAKHEPEDSPPTMTPEEHRKLKIMEALQERKRLDRLRLENDERIRLERREALRRSVESTIEPTP